MALTSCETSLNFLDVIFVRTYMATAIVIKGIGDNFIIGIDTCTYKITGIYPIDDF